MPKVSLSWKIVVSVSFLLVTLIAAMLFYVNSQAESFVNQQMAEELELSRGRIPNAEEQRLSGLRLTAGLVASFPELKALLDTDVSTIRDFLISYQQESRSSQLLIVLDPFGEILARTDGLTLEPLEDVESRWLEPALSGLPAAGVLRTASGIYHAASMPATAGGLVFGFVIAASLIDDTFAGGLRELGRDEVIILDDDVIGATLPAEGLPFESRSEWERTLEEGGAVRLDGVRFSVRSVELGNEGGPRPLVILLRNLDRAMVPYRRIQVGLLVLGLITTAAGIVGSVVLAKGITAPVAKLVEGTRQVMEGNFDYHLDLKSRDEIGALATSFNSMVLGLRERRDMQKFVSQSTVDMIETASRSQEDLAGQLVSRTIFFSDIRGFTQMSELQSPEETIRMLNRCLSLQASTVAKFKGDVDKFVGDSVVAIFEGEDMALNAIRCAVEIQRSLDADNKANPESPKLEVGVGIVTGEVIMGSIGSHDRLDYTVIGSNVNLCSRLCGAAAPHEILLSDSTFLRVKDLVAAEHIDPITVKGFSQPVSVYRMVVR